MPSRAVLRKKARKEKSLIKKSKLEDLNAHKKAINLFDGKNSTLLKKSHGRVSVVDQTLTIDGPGDKNTCTITELSDLDQENSNVSALTHKERKKMEAKKRFAKQVKRASCELSSLVPSSNEKETISAGEKLRHDPRFKNGTFWRDRKERRSRTLFLGGIPIHYSVEKVIDLIMTLLDGNNETYEILQNRPEGIAVVEKVDFLPLNHHSKVRNMFVSIQSTSLAKCIAGLLNGYKVELYALRCNFVDDKKERAEAISRRDQKSTKKV
ncbi:unnamed protein product [Phytomonas sp. Hart1]|nr:unnamed protein product [Phytomonas sp. Hart1]|eukprot:CCW66646.1 unnamed protein product [Phytomonas sp. isolate Hart1]